MASAAGNGNGSDTAARIQTNLAGTNGISHDHPVPWIRRPTGFREPFPFNTIQGDSEQSAEATGPGTCGRIRWHRTKHGSHSAHAARNGNAFEPHQGDQPMAQDFSNSPTRRSVVAAGLALSAAPVALAGADHAYAQAKEPTKENAPRKVCMSGWGAYSPSRR